jgi:hypothetical protein
MFSTAITRKPGKNFAQGITSVKIDVGDLGAPSYPRVLE